MPVEDLCIEPELVCNDAGALTAVIVEDMMNEISFLIKYCG